MAYGLNYNFEPNLNTLYGGGAASYQQPFSVNPFQQYGQYSSYANLLPMREPTGIEALAGMGKLGAAAQYNLKGMDIKPMQDIASQIGMLSKAQIDPTDPLYQRLYEDERTKGMQDLSAAIAEMSRQNRKLSQLGRTPLFNPERGGEMTFRGMTQGYQDAQHNARSRARDILGIGQNSLQNQFANYASLATAKDENQKKKAFGLGNIADVLPLLGKLF